MLELNGVDCWMDCRARAKQIVAVVVPMVCGKRVLLLGGMFAFDNDSERVSRDRMKLEELGEALWGEEERWK